MAEKDIFAMIVERFGEAANARSSRLTRRHATEAACPRR